MNLEVYEIRSLLTLYHRYPNVMWMLSFALVISAIGESFLWPLTTTYIVHVFGKSLQTAAAVLLLQYTGTLIGNVVGGVLFDRWSGRKTVITAILISIVVLLSIGTFQRFSWYLVLIFLLGLCNGTFWPSTRAFAAVLWPEGGRMGMNMLYVANNLGVAIGASVGGIVASYSFRYAFYGNAVTYLVFLLVFMVAIQESYLNKGAAVSSEQVDSVSKSTRQSNKQDRKQLRKGAKLSGDSIGHLVSLGILICGLTFLVVTYSQWQTTISTYVYSIGISLSSYSLLWAVNGLIIVLFQPILSWLIHRYCLRLKAQILVGSCLFAVAMLVVSVWPIYASFVLGMIIITWGEMLVWPAVPTIAAEMATIGKEGLYQGVATTGQSIGRMIGPLFGGFLYDTYSPHTMLSTMIFLAILAFLFFTCYDLVRRPSVQSKQVVRHTS